MENVFYYFVSIGAGLSFGLTLGAIPALMAWRWMMKKREGRNYGAYQAQKARS